MRSLIILAATVLSAYSHPLCFSGKVDIVMAIDVSGSVENRFTANRDAALDVARSLPISWDKASVAVIQYSKLAIMKLEFGSSETWETLNDSISNLEWTGDVALTAEAMDLSMIMFRRARPDSQRVIILFSDGNSFNSWQQVLETSERMRYSEAKIFAVSLSGSTYETELKQYVQWSNGSIIRRQSEFNEMKRELLSMTIPRCPPPAATPPPDFLRPSEGDNENLPENQLPTRRPDNQLPQRRRPDNSRPDINRPDNRPDINRPDNRPDSSRLDNNNLPTRRNPLVIPSRTTPLLGPQPTPPFPPVPVNPAAIAAPNLVLPDNAPKRQH